MFKEMKSKDLKTSGLFALIGLIASTFVGWYQVLMLTEEMRQQVIAQLGSVEALIPIASLQGALLTFIAAFIGLKVARKVNLTLNFKMDKQALGLSVLIGALVAFIITGADRFIFAAYLPEQITEYVFSPIYFVSGLLYGGIVEEVLLRLFVMSLLVLILWKTVSRTKDQLNIPNWIYVAAIIISAVLFAAGHLPITLQTLGSSAPILIRCFLLNGIGGIGFGYLYWKKGLSYSIIAHATAHVFMQAVFMPFLF